MLMGRSARHHKGIHITGHFHRRTWSLKKLYSRSIEMNEQYDRIGIKLAKAPKVKKKFWGRYFGGSFFN